MCIRDSYARVYVPEPMRAQVTVGKDVSVHVDGTAQPYAGRVRFVSTDAAFTPYYALTQKDRSRLSYLAEITMTEAAAQELPTGIPVEGHAPGVAPGRGARPRSPRAGTTPGAWTST